MPATNDEPEFEPGLLSVLGGPRRVRKPNAFRDAAEIAEADQSVSARMRRIHAAATNPSIATTIHDQQRFATWTDEELDAVL